MAMNGHNLILSFTGQEFILELLYWIGSLHNYTEIHNYFSGPAFLAWQRMGNIHGWGGGLDDGWLIEQSNLQKKIVARIRLFGFFPGFNGYVPEALKNLRGDINFIRSAEWEHFGTEYSKNYFVDPNDLAFQGFGEWYYAFLYHEYGLDHFYLVDTYNEMRPPSSDLKKIK